MLFQTPTLSDRDKAVLQELGNYRRSLRSALRQPRRWTGNLRRNLQARAIRGSNTIEGYEVSLDDALAAVDEEEPLDADRSTWAEIIGCRNAMSYIQQLSSAPHLEYTATLLSSLHYMMLSHDLTKLPGHFRPGPIYVHDDETDEDVYEGPNAELVPGLVGELVDWLRADHHEPMFVRAAMAQVGGGSWKPMNDPSPWVSFNLRAHYIQAQTVRRRVKETRRLWEELEALANREGLPERAVPALYDAAVGFRVRRSKYETDADVEPATAGRDLRRMADAGVTVQDPGSVVGGLTWWEGVG